MNVVDAIVIKVLSPPQYNIVDDVDWWSVTVESQDMGGIQVEELTFSFEEEALKVKEGYWFVH